MDIYTTLEEAGEEIRRRWQDKALREMVADFLGGNIPSVFQNEPRAVLDRNIISPDLEFTYFIELSGRANLKPLGYEYLEDKFCSKNPDKLGLVKMSFYQGRNKNGEAITSYRTIVDCSAYDGKHFSEIKTLWGEDLIVFHRRLLSSAAHSFECFDASAWYSTFGSSAQKYYRYLLALFICHGLLFENFVTSQNESEFAERVVLPAVREVEREFGLKPLIVPLAPVCEASDKYWWCYPDSIRQEIERHV